MAIDILWLLIKDSSTLFSVVSKHSFASIALKVGYRWLWLALGSIESNPSVRKDTPTAVTALDPMGGYRLESDSHNMSCSTYTTSVGKPCCLSPLIFSFLDKRVEGFLTTSRCSVYW